MFPYHVWAYLEGGEAPRVAYDRGFLPGRDDMTRFYLTRSVRVELSKYYQNKRIRYVEKKCAHVANRLVPRADFEYSDEWEELAARYFESCGDAAEYRARRFRETTRSAFFTHALEFRHGDRLIGMTPLFVGDGIAHYGIPVYNADYRDVSIGNHMMAAALSVTRQMGLDYCYLGSCYTPGDLYKSRFPGMEFYNGFRWSVDRNELHLLLEKSYTSDSAHLFETNEYISHVGPGDFTDEVLRHRLTVVGEVSRPVGRAVPGE
ncbi:MAG: GNAT family N-acetyltransferase [Streptomyces sp.]|nr:GNAT family N-acetyltransferase [Streptomyces sp.]